MSITISGIPKVMASSTLDVRLPTAKPSDALATVRRENTPDIQYRGERNFAEYFRQTAKIVEKEISNGISANSFESK